MRPVHSRRRMSRLESNNDITTEAPGYSIKGAEGEILIVEACLQSMDIGKVEARSFGHLLDGESSLSADLLDGLIDGAAFSHPSYVARVILLLPPAEKTFYRAPSPP